MQYAVRTRGKSAGDNDYRWRFSIDNSPSVDVNGMGVHEFLSDNGVLVYQNANGTCTVFLLSRPHEKILDYQNRGIRIGLLVTECPAPLAKGFFAYGLEHLDNYLADFQSFIINFGQDNWKIDNSAVEKFIASITPIEPSGVVFTQRTENNCADDHRKALLDEIEHLDWSTGEGFKLVVDNGIMTGDNLHTIRSQVNRYLAKKSTESILGEIRSEVSVFVRVINRIKKVGSIIKCLSVVTIKNNLLSLLLLFVIFIGAYLQFWNQRVLTHL